MLTVSVIIKNIYLAVLSEARAVKLQCNVGRSSHSLVYRLVYVRYNVRKTEQNLQELNSAHQELYNYVVNFLKIKLLWLSRHNREFLVFLLYSLLKAVMFLRMYQCNLRESQPYARRYLAAFGWVLVALVNCKSHIIISRALMFIDWNYPSIFIPNFL